MYRQLIVDTMKIVPEDGSGDPSAQTEDAGRSGVDQQDEAHCLGVNDNQASLLGTNAGRPSGKRAECVSNVSRSMEGVGANGHRDGLGKTRNQGRAIELARPIRTRFAHPHTGSRQKGNATNDRPNT